MKAGKARAGATSAKRRRGRGGRERSALPEVPAGFHYDRRRRLAMPTAPTRARSRGWLHGNRGLRILLLDVVIIGILVAVAARLLQGGGAADRVDEFAIRASTEQRQGVTVLTITVNNERILGRSRPETVVARVSGAGAGSILSGGDAVRLDGRLPRQSGQMVTLRVMLWTPKEPGELLLRISIRDRVVALLVAVEVAGDLTASGGRE